jgi:hypothetical protein
MGVHEDIKAILLRQSQNLNRMADPFLVVLSGASMFYGFPRKDVSDCVVSPSPQAGEVYVGVFGSKGLAHKGDIVTIKEVFDNVRGLVRRFGKFGVGSNVYAMEYYFAIVAVAEAATLNEEDGCHGGDGGYGRVMRRMEKGRRGAGYVFGAKKGSMAEVIALWSQACEQRNVISGDVIAGVGEQRGAPDPLAAGTKFTRAWSLSFSGRRSCIHFWKTRKTVGHSVHSFHGTIYPLANPQIQSQPSTPRRPAPRTHLLRESDLPPPRYSLYRANPPSPPCSFP